MFAGRLQTGRGDLPMKKRRLRRILILAAAVLLCLGMVLFSRSREREATGRITLWYTEADFSPAVMANLIARCRTDTGLRIEARAFPDEQTLGLAFEEGRPELLFCNHFRAARLSENLSPLPEERAFPETLSSAGQEIGSAFFPIGGRLPLLLVNTELTDESVDSLEDLLDAGEGPFLASDDWADLLFTAALSKGCWIQGLMEADAGKDVYRSLFNTLAAAAFRGRLVPTKAAAEYVRQGMIPCAVVPSTELAGLSGDSLQLRLLPLPEGGERLHPAELMGFAVLEGCYLPAAEQFVDWLYSDGQDSVLALSAGLVPVHGGAAARSAAEKSLADFAMSGTVCFLAPDTVFYSNRAAFEQRIAAALDLLA